MTVVEKAPAVSEERPLPPVDERPLRRLRLIRIGQQVAAVAITLFMAVPVYLITLAAFSSRAELNRFPKALWPRDMSIETMSAFLLSPGTGVLPALINSLMVGVGAVLLALLIGGPAGYAIARYAFRGRDAYQMFLLLTKSLPVVVLAIPLASFFLTVALYDTTYAVILVHSVLALPTTVLITASVFVAVPVDLEEAAMVFGCNRFGAFRQVVLPMSLPGVAASSIFTFVLSWNEVLAAAVLTLDVRTLPAQVLVSLANSPLAYQFAGGFVLVLPAVLFILLMRRYLLNMWGSTIR
ncbi:MAG: ABC transporter permease subunit [Micromonosporaceae bacterium]|nr:ABC transporter permease subunit [Micromonosporaceae bacterium]